MTVYEDLKTLSSGILKKRFGLKQHYFESKLSKEHFKLCPEAVSQTGQVLEQLEK